MCLVLRGFSNIIVRRYGRDEIEKFFLISMIIERIVFSQNKSCNFLCVYVFSCSTTFPSQLRSLNMFKDQRKQFAKLRFWDVHLFSVKSLLAANPLVKHIQ